MASISLVGHVKHCTERQGVGRIKWLPGLALALIATVAAASDLTGRASIIDGDTLDLDGVRIRLSGIDAPESNQLCRDADSGPYRCSQQAANALYDVIAKRPVACIEVDRDQYKRVVAVCSVDGVDLADWLVRNGLALDWPRYSKGGYAAAQDEARRNERGVGAGSYVEPWRFRSCVRSGRRPTACSDEAQ
ncbi:MULTISPECIES: thermonuclease family protein [unclassified Bradyrhizobium]|uniref:thermonuclease family protein n=1 Tax=unclassified Bradyrhizobium TaxID=2631580 RepID=UPI002FF110F6